MKLNSWSLQKYASLSALWPLHGLKRTLSRPPPQLHLRWGSREVTQAEFLCAILGTQFLRYDAELKSASHGSCRRQAVTPLLALQLLDPRPLALFAEGHALLIFRKDDFPTPVHERPV